MDWEMLKMNWNDRLRPVVVEQIVGNKKFVTDCVAWGESNKYPSALLLVGPPGTGKTSAAIVVARQSLGDQYNDMNLLWTNASDDRGIGYIRETVKNFARLSGFNVRRKVVILDEACGLTPAGQDSLRGIMEKYTEQFLFILTANYSDKIRPALQSRCVQYTFKNVSPVEGTKHLMRLTEIGAPQAWEENYDDVVMKFHGDLRAAVNWLESLPRDDDALNVCEFPKNVDAMGPIDENEWLTLRENLLSLYDTGGDRMSMMNTFHRRMSQHFDNDADTVFDVLSVWGEMMKLVYEWPASTESYIDVFVGKIKDKLER